MQANDSGGKVDGRVRRWGESKRGRVFIIKEKILIPLAVGRDVSIGSHCRATPERLAAKRGSLMSRSLPHVYLSICLNF